MKKKLNKKHIQNKIIEYLKTGNPLIKKNTKIPLNKSLLELGLVDSFGVIELVGFIEKTFKIEINDQDLTKQRFGSIEKMSELIINKLK